MYYLAIFFLRFQRRQKIVQETKKQPDFFFQYSSDDWVYQTKVLLKSTNSQSGVRAGEAGNIFQTQKNFLQVFKNILIFVTFKYEFKNR